MGTVYEKLAVFPVSLEAKLQHGDVTAPCSRPFFCVTVGGEVSVVLAPGPAENREAGGLGCVRFKLVHLRNVAETSHEQWGLLQNGLRWAPALRRMALSGQPCLPEAKGTNCYQGATIIMIFIKSLSAQHLDLCVYLKLSTKC